MTSEFTDNDISTMTYEQIYERFIFYSRAIQRFNKYGNPTIVKKVGRKTLSPEHKQETYQRTLARKKEQRMEKAKTEGRVYKKGRPVKININTNLNPPDNK